MKKLLLLPILTLMLAACGGGETSHATGLSTGGEGGSSAPATTEAGPKEWKPVTAKPTAEGTYKIGFYQEGLETPGHYFLEDAVPEKNPWYLYMKDADNVDKAADVKVIFSGEQFKIKVGEHYLQHSLSNSKLSNFLVAEADATLYDWDADKLLFTATVANKDGEDKVVTSGTYSTYTSLSSQYADSTSAYLAHFYEFK